MARKINVKLILELRDAQLSRNFIADSRHISRNSVSDVFRIAEERDITYSDICSLTQIRNLQEDINTFRSNVAVFHTTGSGYYFAALTVDGKYGNASANAVKMIQKYFGLTQDGKCGVNTKNALWNALGYNPPAT